MNILQKLCNLLASLAERAVKYDVANPWDASNPIWTALREAKERRHRKWLKEARHRDFW